MNAKRMTGRISYWDYQRGFGFVETESGEKFFCLLVAQLRPRLQGEGLVYEKQDRFSRTAPTPGEFVRFTPSVPTRMGETRRTATDWTLLCWEDAAWAELEQKLDNLARAKESLAKQLELQAAAAERRRQKYIAAARRAVALSLQFVK